MKITLSPVRMDTPLIAEVDGDVLVLNGEKLDLSKVTVNSPFEAPESKWIVGPVTRIKDELQVTVILPHGGHPPEETLFPTPIQITSGKVPLPPFDMPPADGSDF